MGRRSEGGGLAVYYLATPLFAVADAMGVAPFRVAALEGSELRWLYYFGALLCGLACRRWPRSAPWIGMGESSLNLLLLLVSFLVPIWSLPEVAASGAEIGAPVTGADLANLILAGGVLLWSFYGNQVRATRSRVDG